MTGQNGGSEGMRFDILKAVGGDGVSARLGRLALARHQAEPVSTPNFFATTSRGVVPHLTPDIIASHGSFAGFYMALEDLVAKTQQSSIQLPTPPKTPTTVDSLPLNAFTALPPAQLTILGPRRSPAVQAPAGNSNDFLHIFTSNGFRPLPATTYPDVIATLQPDLAIAMADMPYAPHAAPRKGKGQRQMCDRTTSWLRLLLRARDAFSHSTAVFAPTLPVPGSAQREYLAQLAAAEPPFDGLAVYDAAVLPELAQHPTLLPLPRLSLDAPDTPHEILAQIAQGIDAFVLPFVNAASDAGVALTFAFPPSSSSDCDTRQPLGIDLTHPEHALSLAPLVADCTCYACRAHHRAYVHHLLNAREMLAWTLLQLHNHHVVTAFFASVHASLAEGWEGFCADRRRFESVYEEALPEGLGTRPRARGYHFKSEGGDAKRNEVTWRRLQENEKPLEVGSMALGMEEVVEETLNRAVVEKPVKSGPGVDASEVMRESLGRVDMNKP